MISIYLEFQQYYKPKVFKTSLTSIDKKISPNSNLPSKDDINKLRLQTSRQYAPKSMFKQTRSSIIPSIPKKLF